MAPISDAQLRSARWPRMAGAALIVVLTFALLGVGLFHAGRFAEAMEQYRQALKLKPDYAEAHNNLGLALLTTGMLPEAKDQCEPAVRLKPELAEAYNGLGTISRMMSRPEEAIEYYIHALTVDPDYAGAYANLSVAYAQANLPVEAIAAAQKALELARAQDNSDLIQQIEAWLKTYHRDWDNHFPTSTR